MSSLIINIIYVVNPQDEATPLWIACQMGHLQIVKELLTTGADIDKTREVGYLVTMELV